jgi:hypothetical protein
MSEYITSNQNINVQDVDSNKIMDKQGQKTVLTVRAVALSGDSGFDCANKRLIEASQELIVALNTQDRKRRR